MKDSYFLNSEENFHPKNRLLRYSKATRITNEILSVLKNIQRTYDKFPLIIYDYKKDDDMKSKTNTVFLFEIANRKN